MNDIKTVKVSKRYQIVLPSVARKHLNIEAGDHLLVDIQDGVLVLIPQPEDYAKHLAGLHQDVWADIDSDDYLRQERDEWTTSNID